MAAKRHIVVTAVEPKGGVTVDKEPFPATPLPEGGGYVLKQPDDKGRWEVAVYVSEPRQIFVDEGDEVTLEFVGINGASHPTTIEAYGQTFEPEAWPRHQGDVHRRKAGPPQHRLLGPSADYGVGADRGGEEVDSLTQNGKIFCSHWTFGAGWRCGPMVSGASFSASV